MSLRTEQLLSFPEASKIVPGRPAVNSFHRWQTQGIQGHRLETCKVAGRRFTSVEALDRFFDAIDPQPAQDSAPSITPKQRAAAVAAAEQVLVAAGV
jgi:hypothetical protein